MALANWKHTPTLLGPKTVTRDGGYGVLVEHATARSGGLLVCECFLHHLDFMTATAMDPSDWAMYAPCAYDTLLEKRLESAAASVMWLPETSPCGREGLEEDYAGARCWSASKTKF